MMRNNVTKFTARGHQDTTRTRAVASCSHYQKTADKNKTTLLSFFAPTRGFSKGSHDNTKQKIPHAFATSSSRDALKCNPIQPDPRFGTSYLELD